MIDVKTVEGEAWVFLSHSHEDYDKVIQVRNLLEARKFRPLMFFLKCLEEDEEIDTLIKREIDSRNRFVLCDSKNARASRWVSEEVAYIKGKRNRMYEVIDLDSMTIKEIEVKLREFEQRLTFTVLFSQGRQSEMEQVFGDLQSYGFRVQWAVLEQTDDVSQYRSELCALLSQGYVALYPDESGEEFCAKLITGEPTGESTISEDHLLRLLNVGVGRSISSYELIDERLREDEAMSLARFSSVDSRVELLERVAYGGRATIKLALGFMFERGERGVQVDLRRALEYFEDALHDDGMATYEHIKRIRGKIEALSRRDEAETTGG